MNIFEKVLVASLTTLFVAGFVRVVIGVLTGECSNITFGIYG
jgi:hypothetical protein